MKTNIYLYKRNNETKVATEYIALTCATKKEARDFLRDRIKDSKGAEIGWKWNVYNKEIVLKDEHFTLYLRIK